MLCYVVMLCYVMLLCYMLCDAMRCYAMLCYAMLCYVMLCYVVVMLLCYVISTGCHFKVYIYKKTSVPGVFTYYSTRHRRVKDVTVVETNYTEYALVLKHKKFNKEFTQVALYGRTEKLSTDVMEKFRVYATAQGFPKDSILTPPAAENCPSSGS
uniref:Lipocalin/cytosolic fatty-acid binding domain-containing protein n=1 Tax=Cyprinus carpio TaxID=7962 RepID=A0A8C1ZLS0_CYPCA